MPVSNDLLGAHYRHPDSYVVRRETIREFAAAVKHEHPAFAYDAIGELGSSPAVAPLTFTAIFGCRCQRALFEHVNVDVTDAQIVQVRSTTFGSRSARTSSCSETSSQIPMGSPCRSVTPHWPGEAGLWATGSAES